MFGVGFTQGFQENQDRIRTRRAKVNQAFQQWKQANPYASAADFQNAVRSIGGGDLTVATALPGQQAIQRMAQQNQDKKAEDDQRKKFEAMERKLNYNNTLMSTVGNAAKLMGDKASPEAIAQQLGVPVEQVKPAFDNFKAQAEKAEAERQRGLASEGLTILNNALDQGLRAGLRGPELTEFAQGVHQDWASVKGITISAGTVGGSPSSEQAAVNTVMSRGQQLSDAADKQDTATAYNTLLGMTGSPAFQEKILEDPSAAIDDLLTTAQLDFNSNVMAGARSKLEETVQVQAEQALARQEKANVSLATTTLQALSQTEEGAPTLGFAIDAEPTIDAVTAELERQGVPEEQARAAAQQATEASQSVRQQTYDNTFQPVEPASAISQASTNRLQRAESFVRGISGKLKESGVPVFAGQQANVGPADQSIMAKALADMQYSDESQANDIVTVMLQHINEQRDKGNPTPTARELQEAVREEGMGGQFFSDYLELQQTSLLEEVAQEFATTQDLLDFDTRAAESADQNYVVADGVVVDFSRDGIQAAASIVDDAARQAALNPIRQGLEYDLEDAMGHLQAFDANALSIENMTGLDPQYRLAFGTKLDRDLYRSAVVARIDELKHRLEVMLPPAYTNNTSGTDDNGLTPERLLGHPDFVSEFTPKAIAASIRMGGGNRRQPGKDVFFSDVVNADRDTYQLYGLSLVDSFEANSQYKDGYGFQQGAPAIYSALVNGGVPDERVVKAIASAIEAYDFFRSGAPLGRSNRAGEYGDFVDELMPYLTDKQRAGQGYLATNEARDRHAQLYAQSWFKSAIAGMDPAAQDALIKDFTALLEAEKSSNKALNNAHGLREVDLPRLRDSMR